MTSACAHSRGREWDRSVQFEKVVETYQSKYLAPSDQFVSESILCYSYMYNARKTFGRRLEPLERVFPTDLRCNARRTHFARVCTINKVDNERPTQTSSSECNLGYERSAKARSGKYVSSTSGSLPTWVRHQRHLAQRLGTRNCAVAGLCAALIWRPRTLRHCRGFCKF